MLLLILLSVGFTAAALLPMCVGDPKRRRTARLVLGSHSKAVRRVLVLAALLPGVALVLDGRVAAFLIWLGASAILGWLLTLVIAQFGTPRVD
jgi:hypothetical protein